MTLKTLRKERREKFEKIIKASDIFHYGLSHLENLGQGEFAEIMVNDLSEALADAAESRSEVRGIEAAMFADRPIVESDFDPTGEDEALKAFEAALHTPGNWQWHPGKSSDEKAWKGLREFIVKVYRAEGVKVFDEYYTWSIQPYSRGAMTVLAIKRNPADFEASWAAFQASAMFAKRTDEARPEYQPYKPEEKNYVPRPTNIKPIIRKPAE